jgi:hypothetical protein
MEFKLHTIGLFMGSFEDEVKAAFEPKYGRDLSQAEVFEIAFNLRQFATLLQDWAKDEDLMQKLGLPQSVKTSAHSGDLNTCRNPCNR